MSKVAIITGGTGGLGKSVCLAFLYAGYKVVTTYISDKELQDLKDATASFGDKISTIKTDVTDPKSLAELAEKTKKDHGCLDTLVCLVGGYGPGTFGDDISESFDKLMTLNAKSFLLTCNALVPLLSETERKEGEYGHIIAVAAKPALEGGKGIGIYAASKAAVVNLVKTLSIELLDKNICVNAIAPSTIDTPANRESMPKADPSKWVTPEQIAHAIVFLGTDYSGAVSGTVVPVYGKS
jgi:NAD(P)-dependent dehydrogenase (short-subunit alcohol dehydrogenase family)